MTTTFAPSQEGYTVPEFTLGDRLRKARELAGLTQAELAREIGISKNTVANYETGNTPVKRPALVMWSMRTRVPLEWLAEGNTDPQPPTAAQQDPTVNSGWRSRRVVIAAPTRPAPRLHPVAA